ncbi:hypothetical protein WJX72_001296 [[Myrmecia] bisecta]|uniref:Elongator complex protein 1 n=1 Tax=[Myrmecia] bisecta TaxID=41462 RepID=A0AAW1PFN9_9CHLO
MRNLVTLLDRAVCLPPDVLADKQHLRHLCLDSESGNLFVATAEGQLSCLSAFGHQTVWSTSWLDSLATEPVAGPVCKPVRQLTGFAHVVELDALCYSVSTGELVLLHLSTLQFEEVGAVDGGIVASSWSPDGEVLVLVTGLAQLVVMNKTWELREGKLSIVLYERNGLRHGSFDIPEADEVIDMQWSHDSELLAVAVRVPSTADGRPSVVHVQIWHRSNWHWYLKLEWRYAHSGRMVLRWDEVAAMQIHLCTDDGQYRVVGLARDVCISLRGTAAVVDGTRVLLTPLGQGLVPPPMCATAVSFAAPVQAVALRDMGQFEVVAAVTSAGAVAVASSLEADLWEDTLEASLEAQARAAYDMAGQVCLCARPALLDACLPPHQAIRALVWVGPTSLIAVFAAPPGCQQGPDQVVELMLSGDLQGDAGPLTVNIGRTLALPSPLLRAIPAPASGALLQLEDGCLLAYEPGELLLPFGPAADFLEPCPWLVATPEQALLGPTTPPAVGLTKKGQLFWGGQLLADDCTSVVTRTSGPGGAHLLYITRTHRMHIVPFTRLPTHQHPAWQAAGASAHASPLAPSAGRGRGKHDNLHTAMHAAMRPAGANGSKDVNIRAVEQGSRLVAAPPDLMLVVMQMPRGNLEAVYPRALVLAAIAERLEVHDFAAAYQLAARHRVDLNVLVDYKWPEFLAHAPEFVHALRSDQDITDLLAALQPGSTTGLRGLYFNAMPSQSSVQGDLDDQGPQNKVGQVAHALQAAMQAMDSAAFLKPMLTSHAVLGDLEGALALIKRVKETQLEGRSQPPSAGREQAVEEGEAGRTGRVRPPTAEDGLKHLLLTVDVERLYRCALGMYEVELAYMVVAHSQRDPGEYLLELQRFAGLRPPALAKHAIDMHLQRYERALPHLLAAGPHHFEQALQLARDKGLLRELLHLVDSDPAKRRVVLGVQAEVLAECSRHEDAALAYLAAGRHDQALEQYRAAGQWRMVFSLAGRLGWEEVALRHKASEMVEGLAGMGRLADAAAVALDYLADVEAGVSLLTQAREWREALRVAYRAMRGDLVETVVAPAGAEAAASQLTQLREDVSRVDKYLARLKDVQQKRISLQAALDAEDEEGQETEVADVPDDVSETSSVVSGMSAYTSATHSATSTTTSSARPPSTLGGRKPQKKVRKKDKGTRIRQGSPEEEQALAAHLQALQPTTRSGTQVGQLTELLVVLGHEQDARILQQQLSELINRQRAAAAYVTENPPPAIHQHQQALTKFKQTDANPDEGSQWKWDILRPSKQAST